MCWIFQTVPLSNFYILVPFSKKISILEAFLVKKQKHPNQVHLIWQKEIQTYIEPKYDAFNLKNKVSANGLVLLVPLS